MCVFVKIHSSLSTSILPTFGFSDQTLEQGKLSNFWRANLTPARYASNAIALSMDLDSAASHYGSTSNQTISYRTAQMLSLRACLFALKGFFPVWKNAPEFVFHYSEEQRNTTSLLCTSNIRHLRRSIIVRRKFVQATSQLSVARADSNGR